MSDITDSFLDHYGVKGMQRTVVAPTRLTRVARVASGTESKNKNVQKAVKEKLKAMADAIKAEEKKRKEYEDALKELDAEEKNKKEEEDDENLLNLLKSTVFLT
jgi:membrane-associated HD superfamily phosphohydrolase